MERGYHTFKDRSLWESLRCVDTWQNALSLLLVWILQRPPVEASVRNVGAAIEWFLNFHRVNGGFIGIILRILTFRLKGLREIDRWTIIKLLDPRDNLYDPKVFSKEAAPPTGSKYVADVCMMASKLAYENAAIINDTICRVWKMDVVLLQEFEIKSQLNNTTQVLIFKDRSIRPKAIVVAFRGTRFFNTYDWSTDFDFDFYNFEDAGGVHSGFVEALGVSSLSELIEKHKKQRRRLKFHPDNFIRPDKKYAFFEAYGKLKDLLEQHKDAKFYITGHSLGGALAVVFWTLCVVYASYEGELERFSKRLGGVYTFGQPRVGNVDFACYMEKKLRGSYFRVVYSNDLVPRVPFDDINLRFKHVGVCSYFTGFYREEARAEEPNKNFFSLQSVVSSRIMAFCELLQSLFFLRLLALVRPWYFCETWISTGFRCFGLLFPGLADHSPVNYVNAIRLGPPLLTDKGILDNVFVWIKKIVNLVFPNEKADLICSWKKTANSDDTKATSLELNASSARFPSPKRLP